MGWILISVIQLKNSRILCFFGKDLCGAVSNGMLRYGLKFKQLVLYADCYCRAYS